MGFYYRDFTMGGWGKEGGPGLLSQQLEVCNRFSTATATATTSATATGCERL